MQKTTTRIFSFMFCIATLLVLIIMLSGESLTILLALRTLGMGAALLFIAYELHKFESFFSRKTCTTLATILILFMFIVQLVNCLKTLYIPKKGDYEAVYTGIKELVAYGRFTDSTLYYQRHNHQLFSTVIYAAFNRLCTGLGAANSVSVVATSIFNSALACTGAALLFGAIKKLKDSRAALFCLLLFCLNISYYICTTLIYPHVISVVFICALLNCAASVIKPTKRPILALLLCGASCGLAYLSEGIFAIALIAMIIWLLIKHTFKKALMKITFVLIGFIVIFFTVQLVYNTLNIIDTTNAENEKFPLTHWIMMGLKDNGIYNEEDYTFTVNLPTKEEKSEKTIEQIKLRLSEKNAFEIIKLISTKEKTAWLGNVYGTGWVSGLAVWGNHHNAYSLVLMLFIFIVAIFKFANEYYKKNEPDFFLFCAIWMVGLMLFFAVWESAPLYLFSSLPVVIAAASYVFEIVKPNAKELPKKLSHNAD